MKLYKDFDIHRRHPPNKWICHNFVDQYLKKDFVLCLQSSQNMVHLLKVSRNLYGLFVYTLCNTKNSLSVKCNFILYRKISLRVVNDFKSIRFGDITIWFYFRYFSIFFRLLYSLDINCSYLSDLMSLFFSVG